MGVFGFFWVREVMLSRVCATAWFRCQDVLVYGVDPCWWLFISYMQYWYILQCYFGGNI
jgi:hypothetical protein